LWFFIGLINFCLQSFVQYFILLVKLLVDSNGFFVISVALKFRVEVIASIAQLFSCQNLLILFIRLKVPYDLNDRACFSPAFLVRLNTWIETFGMFVEQRLNVGVVKKQLFLLVEFREACFNKTVLPVLDGFRYGHGGSPNILT
jgi:hypothetical protein